MIASGSIESILRQARDAGIYGGPTNPGGDIVDAANRAVDRFLDQAPGSLRKGEVGLFIAAVIQLYDRGLQPRDFALQPPFPRAFARTNWIIQYDSNNIYIPRHRVEETTRVITGLICRTVPRFYEVVVEVQGRMTHHALQWKLDPRWGYIATFPSIHIIKRNVNSRIRMIGPTTGSDLVEPLGAVISDDWEIIRPEHIHIDEAIRTYEQSTPIADFSQLPAEVYSDEYAKEDSEDPRVGALVDAVEKKGDEQ